MSIVPNETLESADSLNLKVFEISQDIAANVVRDIFNEHLAFWKTVIIRNFQPADDVTYRTDPDRPFKTIPPLAERTVKGWGSFLQVQSVAAVPDGEMEFECVTLQNARRKNG